MPEPEAQPATAPEPEPEPELEPEPAALSVRERLRRAGWTHAITVGTAVLAAVAAIGGLWAQAVATYWTQQTAKDQLSQSREDSQREEQAQASRVTFWLEYPPSGEGPELHVLNRSLDPVTDVFLGARRFTIGLYSAHMDGNDLPPCTERVFDTDEMVLVPRSRRAKTRGGMERFTPMRVEFKYLMFVDSHGKEWERSPTVLYDRSALRDDDPVGSISMGQPRVKEAESCGDDRS
ncbi:hypothetical protein [Streptomyces sp. NBC_00328]|uniref:hypothetical protein n=1 Tax=Streptomyces sp. NBC_00328 TaxID=2903646 RepID=UPI002E28CE36|nr:hypothetical protein [Streptomyces sp. NBC_00328]